MPKILKAYLQIMSNKWWWLCGAGLNLSAAYGHNLAGDYDLSERLFVFGLVCVGMSFLAPWLWIKIKDHL